MPYYQPPPLIRLSSLLWWKWWRRVALSRNRSNGERCLARLRRPLPPRRSSSLTGDVVLCSGRDGLAPRLIFTEARGHVLWLVGVRPLESLGGQST